MHESTPASPRLRAAAALALVIALIAAFAWLTHSGVAGAAPTTPSNGAPAATQPYGSGDTAAPAADGHPCPKDQQGSGDSGAQPTAPSQGESTANL